MSAHLLATFSAAALLGTAFATVDGKRSADALPAAQMPHPIDAFPAGQACRIDVVRRAAAGTAQITRAVDTDGSCTCTVMTGPVEGNGAAEAVVAALLRDRSCDGAPPPGKEAAFAPAGVGVWPFIVAPAGAAGLAAAAGNDSAG